MAGLIRKDDIEAVRNAARIEDVVGDHVTLKPAGIGSLKGLCPWVIAFFARSRPYSSWLFL